ncbi:MAG: relaxase, partial [Ruminococcus sp.]|nr:relaxase [Ruminococcus sp.]
IKEREQQLIWLRTYQNSKPFHDHYISLKGRKQKKYADQFDAELYRYSATESELKKAFPKKIPTVEQLEKHIAKLRGKQENMNTKYDALDQKSRELSEAAREIENYLNQEQKREKQKKKNRSVLE